MDNSQNLTDNKPATELNKPDVRTNPMAVHGESYINFCAVQGLVTNEDGTLETMTAKQFAERIGVARETLYDWQKRIPDFWVKVQARRQELGGRNRIAKIYNGLYLKAASGNPQAAALYLANNDPNFRMPSQKIEHEAGSTIVELLKKARENQRLEDTNTKVIEAEVVNDPPNDNA